MALPVKVHLENIFQCDVYLQQKIVSHCKASKKVLFLIRAYIYFKASDKHSHAALACLGITRTEPHKKCEIAFKLPSHTAFKSIILSTPDII